MVKTICRRSERWSLLLIAPYVRGQKVGTELNGAAERFLKAERELRADSKEGYWLAREKMSVQLLAIAESDLASKDAEKLLHWILNTTRMTPTVLKAAKHIAEHHAASELTMNELLRYAQQPRQWTPELFATYSKIELNPEQRSLLELYRAMHNRRCWTWRMRSGRPSFDVGLVWSRNSRRSHPPTHSNELLCQKAVKRASV